MTWLEKLNDRYLFTGQLVMESGLHIGGGRDTLTTTDSAVMKYIDDRPYIPGSSMKGAFRSAVERISASLPGVRTCALFSAQSYLLEMKDVVSPLPFTRIRDEQDAVSAYIRAKFSEEAKKMLTTWEKSTPLSPNLEEKFLEEINRLINGPSLYDKERFRDVELRKATNKLVQENHRGRERKNKDVAQKDSRDENKNESVPLLNRLLLEDVYTEGIARLCPTLSHSGADVTSVEETTLKELCSTCHVFGSPFMASKVRFSDLKVIDETWAGLTEVRDGVGIDRDNECAVPMVKYDYEVVPSGTVFEFHLVVENPNPARHELALISIGLRELQAGMIPIGGIRTRGLGRCRLDGLSAYHLCFTDSNKFKAYLSKGNLKADEFKLKEAEAQELLDSHIDSLFA